MLLALRSLYENAGDCTVILDGLDLAISLADLTATGDSNLALDGIDLVLELGALEAQLPTSQGGGVWRGWNLGIGPYTLQRPRQDANIELTGIQLKLKLGKLKAKGEHNDLTDEELLLIVTALVYDGEGDVTLKITS